MIGNCAESANKSRNKSKSKKSGGKDVQHVPVVGAFQPAWLWQDTPSATKASSTIDEHSHIKLENPEPWTAILSSPSDFESKHFSHVLENLLRNPNITSSCLFRADILYDSAQDKQAWDDPGNAFTTSKLVKWMKKELQPKQIIRVPSGFRLKRTVVRKLVSRKPWLDPELCQTVHFLESTEGAEQESIVVFIPHADTLDKIPFYHPKVRALSVSHHYSPSSAPCCSLLLSYQLFTTPPPAMLDDIETEGGWRQRGDDKFKTRLQRTALNFLQIIHKHGTGQKAGYVKRVHHDQIIPQQIFQNTYTVLKAKYSRSLLDQWAEVTDPLKHVFEDLGIAAFLIEVWRTMYDLPPRDASGPMGGGKTWTGEGTKPPFPGFVDVGCGNGVLVYLLLTEGFTGWGFDARRRKSWEVFPKDVQECLEERVLIPKPYQQQPGYEAQAGNLPTAHDGIFKEGTFIVSNHADQLTPWTPLMAYLSNSQFIAIPCCSHGLSGKLQRFYDSPPKEVLTGKESKDNHLDAEGPVQGDELNNDTARVPSDVSPSEANTAEKGSLVSRSLAGPSAYAGLTAHVMNIALHLGFSTQQESLRIPSTRNLCVLGRLSEDETGTADIEARLTQIHGLLQQEVGDDVQKAADEWVKEALSLTKAKMTTAGAHGKSRETVVSADEKRRARLKKLGLEGMDELDLIE